MPLKGKTPVNPDQVPDGETCIQVFFRVGDDLYCYNMMGPTNGLLASEKMRKAAMETFTNVFISNAAAAMGYEVVNENSYDVEGVPASALTGEVQGNGLTQIAQAANPSFAERISRKLRGH